MEHPLPYYQGAYWVDNSTLDHYRECPKLYEYSSLRGRRNVFSRSALNYGKAIHKALSVVEFTTNLDYSKVDHEALAKFVDKHFEENPQPPDDHRQAGLAKETLRRYCSLYEIEPFSVLSINKQPIIERVLWTRIGEHNNIPINYFCLLDLMVSKQQEVWVIDHKTTSRLGDDFRYDMAVTNQMKGYMWTIEQVFGIKPTGYIINAIRSLSPSKTALKSPDSLAIWWQDQFQRLPFYRDEDSVQEWLDELDGLLDKILADHLFHRFLTNRKSCVGKYGRCQFYDICTLPRHQRLVALNSNNFEDDNWVEETLKGKV